MSGATDHPQTHNHTLGPPAGKPLHVSATKTRHGLVQSRRNRLTGLAVLVGILALTCILSLTLGSKTIPFLEVWDGLINEDSPHYSVVSELRLPRTVLGLLAGLALGLAGALMQAMTRNPLADPGLLGINTGAAAAVVSAIHFLGINAFSGYLWFSFAGAALAGTAVYLIAGISAATPARLALAGAALTAAGTAYVRALELVDTDTLDQMRFWSVGSLNNAQVVPLLSVALIIGVGTAVVFALARPLNALALGDDAARSLGANPTTVRITGIVAITLLCGAATAACGPIVFVGLAVPHIVRAFVGANQLWTLLYCTVAGPIFLLTADVIGRIAGRPSEMQVGIVCAVIGGPFFIYLVTRRKVVRL